MIPLPQSAVYSIYELLEAIGGAENGYHDTYRVVRQIRFQFPWLPAARCEFLRARTVEHIAPTDAVRQDTGVEQSRDFGVKIVWLPKERRLARIG